MSRLHQLSMRLVSTADLEEVYYKILDAVIELHNADFGNIQIHDPISKELRIVAARNFNQEFLDYFRVVSAEDSSACGLALKAGERVIIEDVETDPDFAPHRHIAASAGYRAVQSTPMYVRSGEPLGMISTHFRQPHRSSERELRLTDLFVHLAEETIKRKRAEEALRDSEERFRSYFELGLIGMAITSPTKAIAEVNDELCRILGYERHELLQMTWADMTHPDDLAVDEALFGQIMAGEIEDYSIDKRWIRKDGDIIDSNISVRCVRRADNSVDYFVALLQEITERKRAEAALRKSEARFRAVADLVPDLLWSRNAQGTVEWYNRRWTEYTGQSSEAASDFGWLDVIHPDDREDSLALLQSALSSGQPLRQERRIRGTDGSYCWFLIEMRPSRDESGQVVNWFSAATDIHEQRMAREELEARVQRRTAELAAAQAQSENQRQRLHDIVMDIPAVITVLRGPEHRYELVNPTFLKTMNKREEDVIGRNFGEIFPEGQDQGWIQAADQVYRTGKPHVSREALGWMDRDGDGILEETYWNSIAVPLRDVNGQIEGIMTHGVEVTDEVIARRQIESLLNERGEEIAARQAAEEELRITNDHLRALSGRLLAVQEEERHTIARELHDEIGQQLTALRFMLEGLGQDHPGQEIRQRDNMLSVVDNLTTRVRELSLDLRPAMLDDVGLGPALLWLVERYTAQTGIEVNLAHRGMEERLPSSVETALYRIVQEALTNVARHAGVQQATVQVLVDGSVTVLVEDMGKGFDVKEALARHTSTGLSGMRERVELLGGQLTIESQPESRVPGVSQGGTKVIAEIPLEDFPPESE
jgi:PAS domain S-box-containing protein